MSRRLVTTLRDVPSDREDAYLRGWDRLADAVADAGGRAWLFRGRQEPHRYVEFIEFEADADPLAEPDVRRALDALDSAFGDGTMDEWTGVRA